LFPGNARHLHVSDIAGADFVIVRARVMAQNDVCVWIKFDCDPAMAASFFQVNLAIPGQILFFVLFLAARQLV